VAGAIFIALGVFVGLTTNVFPVQATVEAAWIDSLFNFMLAIAVVIFLVVEVGLIYSIIRFRRRKGDNTDGKFSHGNWTLEIIWTAIPAVIVLILTVFSMRVYADIENPNRPDLLPVTVVGQQFQWKFLYELPASAVADTTINDERKERLKSYMTSNELVLPVNRNIKAIVEATDVMHAFFVPEFRIKQDAIPGRSSPVYFTTSKTGTFQVKCAELCGTGHGAMSMVNQVRVVEAAEYDQFVDAMYQKALEIVNNPRSPEVGKQLIAQKYPCSGCHILDDAWTLQNKIGPTLNGIATRAEGHAAANEGLLGGTKDAANYIRASIVNPNLYLVGGYSPGIMPQIWSDRTQMPEDDLEAIVAYLLTQK
jgi:cytochrome c oxidase subunit 2